MKTQKLLVTLVVALTGWVIVPQSSSFAAVFITSTNISVGDTNSDGQDIIVSGCTLTVDGPHSFASLLLTNGATLTHTPAYAGETNHQINLAITGDCIISADSMVNSDARGYAPGTGPGSGYGGPASYGSGGGHGGWGGISSDGSAGGDAYDSITAPVAPGSGGGAGYSGAQGGSGGGVIRLKVGGTLQLDGYISCRGGDNVGSFGGGGAGGTVNLTAGIFAGSGGISTSGGFAGLGYRGGGGAGGRVVVYFGTMTFSGSISAVGGYGDYYAGGPLDRGGSLLVGGAGTIYLKGGAKPVGDLTVDSGARFGNYTPLASGEESFNALLLNHASLIVTGAVTLTSLHLTTNTVLTYVNAVATNLTLTVISNLTVDAGAAINADAAGFAAGTGPGAGATGYGNEGGGGSHGGDGGISEYGAAGGAGYDSIIAPVLPGSGGGGNGSYGSYGCAGGGVIDLHVPGTLQLDGGITARGGNLSSFVLAGGGGGGSIRLTVGSFSGRGYISADGGNGAYGGGGGGGRITIFSSADNFSGSLSAGGGDASSGRGQKGGAGTIYRQNLASGFNRLTIDNLGRAGAITRLTNAVPAFDGLVDLRLQNYARVQAEVPLNFFGLVMNNNATLLSADPLAGLHVLLTGNAQMDDTSALNLDGGGYPSGTGPGAGGGSYGGGGGHAGAGGFGWNGGTPGGATNGDFTTPGSGGGGGFYGAGGAGGGVIHFVVAGNLDLEGALTANGNNGGAGGAAGGGIFLRAGSLYGHGGISANGANGGPYAGGGGGGFLDVGISDTNGFEGALTANGGLRGHYTAADGESGQVLFQSSGPPTNYFLGWFPSGTLIHPVSSVTFALAGGPHFPAASDFQLVTPAGVLPGNQLSLTSDGNFLTLNFPAQAEAGDYAVRLPANPRTPGTSNYLSAAFSIASLQISGRVTLTNGWPLQGIRVGGGTTLTNGYYSFMVDPGSSGSFAPVLSAIFTPALRSYANIVSDLTGQDFTVSGALNPTLASSLTNSGATAHLEADAIAGLRYQLQSSTNLWDWLDYGPSTISPTNQLHFDCASTNAPQQFFRLRVSPP